MNKVSNKPIRCHQQNWEDLLSLDFRLEQQTTQIRDIDSVSLRRKLLPHSTRTGRLNVQDPENLPLSQYISFRLG